MALYSVLFKPSVEKDLRSLPKAAVARVLEQIEALGELPFPRGVSKLAGTDQLYRIRVGDDRVVYEVDDASQQVTIHHVRHRREAYRAL